MQSTPGIYVEIRGNSSQLREELKKVKAETDQLSKDVSKSLNGMFSAADVRKAVDSLANDLSRVNILAKSASKDIFKGQSEAVDKFAKSINMAGKEYLDLQNKMLSNKAATSQEAALNRIAKAAGLTTREIQELGKQMGMMNKSAESMLQSGIKSGLDSIALSLDRLKAASSGAGLTAVSKDLADAAKAANLTEQEFKELQDQIVKTANTKALESSLKSIATAAGMSAAQIDAFGTKMGASVNNINSVKAALGLLPPEIVSVGNALKSGLQSKFEEVAVSIERLKTVSKSGLFAGVPSSLQEVAVAANLTEQEFKELYAQIASVSATKTAESSLKSIATAAGMSAAQIDAFGAKMGASVANIRAVKDALGLLPPEIQTIEQALRGKMLTSLDAVANSLNTLRASARGGSFGAVSADLAKAASAANLTEQEFKELQDQIVKTANTKALESSLKSIAAAAGMSAAQVDAFGAKMGASVKNIENVKAALGLLSPEIVSVGNALKSGLQSKFEEVAVSIERLKAVSKSDFFAGVSSRLQEVAVAANLTEQEFKELHAQITSVSATKALESSLKSIAAAAGMSAAQVDAFGIKLGASVANIHAVKAALGLLPPEIQTLEQALRGKMQASLDSVANSLNTLRASAKGGSFGALSADLKSAASAADLTEKEFKELQDQIVKTANTKALESSLKSIATAAGMSAAQIDAFGAKMGASVKNIENVKAALGQMKPKTTEAASALDMVGVAIGSAFGSLAGQAIGSVSLRVVEFTKAVVESGLAMDSLKMSYSAIFGGQTNAAREMGYVSETADRLGQSFLKLADSYRLYSAAAKGTSMSSKELKDGFESITAASTTLGLSTERTELVFKAFTQIMSKGQVMMEEVKNQLGDSLPGALDLFARSLGVSKSQFMELAKEGKLLSDDVLPKVFAEMKKTYELAAETAALETGRAAVNRLASEWDKFKISLFDTKAFVVAANGIAMLVKAARSAVGAADITDKLIAAQRELASYESGLGEGLPFYESGLKKAREEVIKLKDELRQLEDPAKDSFQALADGAAKAESRAASYISQTQKANEEVRKLNQTELDRLNEQYDALKVSTTDKVGLEKWYNSEVAKLQASADKKRETSLKKGVAAENKAVNDRQRAIEAYYNYIGNQASASSANQVANIEADRDKLLKQLASNLSATKDYEAMRQKVISESARRVAAVADEEAKKRESAIDAYYDYVGSKAAGSEQNQIDRERRSVDALIERLRQDLGETQDFLDKKEALLKTYDKKETDIVEKGEKERSAIREEMEDGIFDAYATDLQKQARALDKYLKEQKEAYMEANASLIADGKKTTEAVSSEFDALAVRYREAMEYANDPTIQAFREAWDSAIERLDDAFLDLWESFLDGGESAFDAFKNLFKNLLAELAHAAITKPIVVQLGASMSEMLYGQGSATGGVTGGLLGDMDLGSLFNLTGGGGSIVDSINSWGAETFGGLFAAGSGVTSAGYAELATNVAAASPAAAESAMAASLSASSTTLLQAVGGLAGLGTGILQAFQGGTDNLVAGIGTAISGALAFTPAAPIAPIVAIGSQLLGGLFGDNEGSPSVIYQGQDLDWGSTNFQYHTKSGGSDDLAAQINDQLAAVAEETYAAVETMLTELGDGYAEQLQDATITFGRKTGGLWTDWDFGSDHDLDALMQQASTDLSTQIMEAAQGAFESAGRDLVAGDAVDEAMASLGEESAAQLQSLLDVISAGVVDGDVATYASQIALLNTTMSGISTTWSSINKAAEDLIDPPSEYESAVASANTQFDEWVNTLESLGFAEDKIASIESQRATYLEQLAQEYGESATATQTQIDAHADIIAARDAEVAAMEEQVAALDTLRESLATQAADALAAGDGVGYVAARMEELANGLIEGRTMPAQGEGQSASAFNYDYGLAQLPYIKEAAEALSASALSIDNAGTAIADTMSIVNLGDLVTTAAGANAQYFADAIGSPEVIAALSDAFGASLQLDYTNRYSPQGEGLTSVYYAQGQAEYVSQYDYSTGQYGVDVAAYIDAMDKLDAKLDTGAITSEQFAEAVALINGVLPQAVDLVGDLEAQIERMNAAAVAVGYAGMDSLTFYFGELSTLVENLSLAAEEAATPLGELESSIGLLNSLATAFGESASAASFAVPDMVATQATGYGTSGIDTNWMENLIASVNAPIVIGQLIADAATEAATILTTQSASEIADSLAGLPEFASLLPEELRDVSLLLDGIGQFDSSAFLDSFYRISDALAEGTITAEQFEVMFGLSMDVFQNGMSEAVEDAVETLDPQALADAWDEILRASADLINPPNSYESEMRSINAQYDEWIDTLTELGATTDQLARIEADRITVLENLATATTDAINDMIAGAYLDVNPENSYQSAITAANESFDSLIESLNDLSATSEDLAAIENLRADALEQLADQNKSAISDILSGAYLDVNPENSYQSAITAANTSFDSLIESLTDLSATSEDLAAIENLRADALEQLADQNKSAISDILDSSRLIAEPISEYDSSISSLNDQFDSLIQQLQELGATSEYVTQIELDRTEALADLAVAQADLDVESARTDLQSAYDAEASGFQDIIDQYAADLAGALSSVEAAYASERATAQQTLDDYNDELESRRAELEGAYNTERARLEGIISDHETRLADARSAVQEAYDNEASAIRETAESFMDLANGLREWREALLLSDEAFLTATQRLSEAQRQYAITSASAKLGDKEALENLPGVASNYLDAGVTQAATREDYARMVATVLSDVQASEDTATRQATIAEQQLESLNAQVAGILDLSEQTASLADALAEYSSASSDQSATNTQAQLDAMASQLEALGVIEEQAVGYEAAFDSFTEWTEGIEAASAEAAKNQLVYLEDQYKEIQDLNKDTIPDFATAIETYFKIQKDQSAKEAEANLLALQNLVNPLLKIDTSVLSVKTAIDNLNSAVQAQLAAQAAQAAAAQLAAQAAASKSNIPGFASGGYHSGGLRIVGENGPEMEYTGPSRIWNADDTRDILTSGSSQAELVAEIQQLRAEIRAANGAIARNTMDTAKLMRRWDGDGMPDVRTA